MNRELIKTIIAIITGTPLWVWAVLGYILFVGVYSMRTRVVSVAKLFIIPIVLIGLKYEIFTSGNYIIITSYAIALLIGCLIGFVLTKDTAITVLDNAYSIEIPGNYSTLIILLIFFSIKYVFGYLHDVAPAIAFKYLLLDIIISALCPGYFLGKHLAYLRRTRILRKIY